MTKAAPVSEALYGKIEGAYLTAREWPIGHLTIVFLLVVLVREDTAGMDRLAE